MKSFSGESFIPRNYIPFKSFISSTFSLCGDRKSAFPQHTKHIYLIHLLQSVNISCHQPIHEWNSKVYHIMMRILCFAFILTCHDFFHPIHCTTLQTFFFRSHQPSTRSTVCEDFFLLIWEHGGGKIILEQEENFTQRRVSFASTRFIECHCKIF